MLGQKTLETRRLKATLYFRRGAEGVARVGRGGAEEEEAEGEECWERHHVPAATEADHSGGRLILHFRRSRSFQLTACTVLQSDLSDLVSNSALFSLLLGFFMQKTRLVSAVG